MSETRQFIIFMLVMISVMLSMFNISESIKNGIAIDALSDALKEQTK